MSASLLKFEVERTGEGWWGGVAWVCTGPVITMVRCLRQPDNNPLNRIGDAVATVKIPLANVRKINILLSASDKQRVRETFQEGLACESRKLKQTREVLT